MGSKSRKTFSLQPLCTQRNVHHSSLKTTHRKVEIIPRYTGAVPITCYPTQRETVGVMPKTKSAIS
jgi:hypothetical protein